MFYTALIDAATVEMTAPPEAPRFVEISRQHFGGRLAKHRSGEDEAPQIHKASRVGAKMPPHSNSLKDQLSRHKEIDITVTGRKSGRAISIPVWFASEGSTLYLLPVQGSDTQWYKNLQAKPSLRIAAGEAHAELNPDFTTDPKQVAAVVEKFRARYGAGDVKKYYSKFDVAVLAHLA
jgi:deazaflavin-dependent oxidoreductase (nitroreductase family)